MSKQPHDQDEQQTPPDAASATSEDKAGKGDETASGGSEAENRSRRRGKGRRSRSEAAAQDKSAEKSADKSAPVSANKADSTASPASKPGGDSRPSSGKAKTTAGKTGKASSGGGGGAAPRATSGGGQGGGKTGSIALVLVVVLAIVVGLLGWQGWQKLQAQQQRLSELMAQTASQSELDELAARLDQGEQQRQAALEEALSSLREEFSSYRDSVDETLDQVLDELSSEQQTDERDWLHAEAAYLLRLANQRLQLERDVQGAAALLRTADERLREADNPALMPVRREIASELAALESVPKVDRTGIWLALNAQQEQIARQPLAQDIEEIAADASIEQAPSGGWQQQLARFGEELKDLVTVRQHDAALEALISPEQETYLRQSVRLVIEQAQLALLKEEQPLYEASLDKALTLIQGYYDTDASGVQSVISRLQELKAKAIRPELPDISGSQQALAAFIERRFESRRDGGGGNGQGDDA